MKKFMLLFLLLYTTLYAYNQDLFLKEIKHHQLDQNNPAILKQKVILIDSDFIKEYFHADTNHTLQTLSITLFDSKSIEVDYLRATNPFPNEYTWEGKVENHPEASVLLSMVNRVISGTIHFNEKVYKIKLFQKNADYIEHLLIEEDSKAIPQEHPIGMESGAPIDNTNLIDLEAIDYSSSADNGSIIDVMVVYTPQAKIDEGGVDAINALINLAVEETNQGYVQSGINPKLRLVHKQEINYVEDNNMRVDLNRLKHKTDGYMDEVFLLKKEHAADMVALIRKSGNYCGIAGAILATADTAVQVTSRTCATGYYSFGHEFGHLQGARHDWYVDSTNNSPHTHNHGYNIPEEKWRTVMSYNNACSSMGNYCWRINYWSNPDKTHPTTGSFMGIADGEYQAADNRLTLNKTAQYIANFEQSISPPHPPTYLTADNITSDSATLSWQDSANDETGFKIYKNETLITTLETNTTTHTLTGLTPNTHYTYSLTAFNHEGESKKASVTFTTHPVPATLTSPSQNATLDSSTTTFEWENIQEVSEVVITIYDENHTCLAKKMLPACWGNCLTFHNLPQNGQPLIIELNSNYKGTWYEKTYTLNTLKVPNHPTHLETTAITNTTATLSWQDSANDETGFKIYKNETLITTLEANTTTHTLTGLTPNTHYTYSLTAFNHEGESKKASVTFTTHPVPATLTSPSQNATLDSSTTTFEWENIQEVSEVVITIYDENHTCLAKKMLPACWGNCLTFHNLPQNGQPLIIELNSNYKGTWYEKSYSFKTLNVPML
jgi:flagellar hook assembly protein FlgD